MIHSITLNNYMSHKDSTFELHPGMNAIIGESRAGKSTVIRALDLTRKNAIPVRHISRWARKRNKKGDMVIAGRMSISITTGKGTVERFRDAKENGYTVNGKKLVAVGTDVPAEVAEVLNLSDVNFALQHDPHFFLSWTPGAISRYLNDICGMEVIDRATAIAIRLRNTTRAEVDKASVEAETHAKAVEALHWVDRADDLLVESQKTAKCAEQARISDSKLGAIVGEALTALGIVGRTKWASAARIAHTKAIEGAEGARNKWIKFGSLAGLVRGAEEAWEALERTARFGQARIVFAEANEAVQKAVMARRHSVHLAELVEQATFQLATIARTARYSEAEALLKVAEVVIKSAETSKSDAKALQDCVFSASKALQVLSTVDKWPKAREVLERAKKVSKKAEMARSDALAVGMLADALGRAGKDMEHAEKAVELLKLQRAELVAKMPKVCPTCGQPINNCHLAL